MRDENKLLWTCYNDYLELCTEYGLKEDIENFVFYLSARIDEFYKNKRSK